MYRITRLLLLLLLFAPLAMRAEQTNISDVNGVTQSSNRVIKGTVIDDTGEPLIGVTVLVRGTTTGAATDFNGNYSITVSNDAVLDFSYIGYKKASLSVASTKSFDVVMQAETQMLKEVVVAAMGITREAKTLTPNNTGAGGGATKIELRGSTSILGTNRPLIVIDGIPMQEGVGTQAGADDLGYGGKTSGDDLLSTINPEDIEYLTI